jgi:hypothetical protein
MLQRIALISTCVRSNRKFQLDFKHLITYKHDCMTIVKAIDDQNDAILHPYLTENDDACADEYVSQLMSEHTESTIKDIVRSKLRVSLFVNDGSHSNQEALDLVTEVQSSILERLRKLKRSSAPRPIGNFQAYVATMTFNACHQLLRQKYPKRLRLKNKLRYLLTHEPQFVLWEDRELEWLCTLKSLQSKKRSADATPRLHSLREERINTTEALTDRCALIDLLESVLERLDGPVSLDELVSVIGDQAQMREDVAVDDISAIPLRSDPIIMTELEQRAELQRLWGELCQLPLRHRVALLLNLRDPQGGDSIAIFPLARVATIRQIAEVLEFDPEKFALVWNDLPWDDLKIANHLQLTRQQVINLRQSARARLARRLGRSS